MSKRYSKNEDLFILNETLNHKSLKEAFSRLAPVLNRTEKGIEQRYNVLRKQYPSHPTYKIDWRKGNDTTKKESFFKTLWNKLFKK